MRMQPFPFLIPSLLLLIALPTRTRGEKILLLGVSPSLTLFQMRDMAGDSGSFQLLPALGISLGYETHFLPKLGLKAESRIFAGPTWINFDVDTSDQAGILHTESFSGGKGITSGASLSGQVVIGPFSGLVFEPGLGMTWIRRSAANIRVNSDSHTTTYRSYYRQTLMNTLLGMGLYLGGHDQFHLGGLIRLGWDIDHDVGVSGQWELKLAYAFRFPPQG